MTNLDHLFCDPSPSPSCQRMGLVAGQKEGYLQLYPLQAAVMAVGPLVLFPGLIVESWQGVSIEPLKLAPNWGSIKQCPPGSLVGCPGPWRRTKVEPNPGRCSHGVSFSPEQQLPCICSVCHHQKKNKVVGNIEAICQGGIWH